MTGINSPYEAPSPAEAHIRLTTGSLEDSVALLLKSCFSGKQG